MTSRIEVRRNVLPLIRVRDISYKLHSVCYKDMEYFTVTSDVSQYRSAVGPKQGRLKWYNGIKFPSQTLIKPDSNCSGTEL